MIRFLDRKELQEIETKIEPTMRDMFRDMDDTYITGVFLTKYLAGSKNAEQITVQVKKSIARELQDVLHASIVPIDPSAAPQNQTGMYQVTFTVYSAITAMKDELLTSVPKQAQVIFRGYILDSGAADLFHFRPIVLSITRSKQAQREGSCHGPLKQRDQLGRSRVIDCLE